MAYYLAEDSESLEQERIFAKIKKNVIAPGTEIINPDEAKEGWTKYYDNGIVTFNADLFFQKERPKIRYIKTRTQIYNPWRHGYR